MKSTTIYATKKTSVLNRTLQLRLRETAAFNIHYVLLFNKHHMLVIVLRKPLNHENHLGQQCQQDASGVFSPTKNSFTQNLKYFIILMFSPAVYGKLLESKSCVPIWFNKVPLHFWNATGHWKTIQVTDYWQICTSSYYTQKSHCLPILKKVLLWSRIV